MAGRGPQSFQKRQKEQQRKERQDEKKARKVQRQGNPEQPESDEDMVAMAMRRVQLLSEEDAPVPEPVENFQNT